ncbi:hypothetical protein CF8_0055 [Aeromonas phage CF8]|nr:hypothetical protein CF8_0055 [Aeromonas phage CF8]
MNATSAFMFGCGGSLSEGAAASYNSFMGGMYQQFSNLGGWLSGAVESVKKSHEKFMNSRMWEFSNRVGKDGHYVGRFEIGYLSDLQYQQQALGFMRNYIMANPETMKMYLSGHLSGYDGEFSERCSGIGRENYFYNKSVDGMNRLNDDGVLLRTDYTTTRDSGSRLSVRERIDIHRTWNASNLHLAKELLDPTSIEGDQRFDDEQALERLEERRKALETTESGD